MILCVNPGSSSLKYKLYKNDLTLVKSGSFTIEKKSQFPNFNSAILKILEDLDTNLMMIKSVCVRVVHGGGIFNKVTLISNEEIKQLEQIKDFAPLHNPSSLLVIKILKKQLKNLPVYADFDTAFFANLPESSKNYAIPLEVSQKYNIKRFGAHGISHKFVLKEVDPENKSKVISVHLGAGCSVCAIDHGNPIDISMGFTPEEGLVMQTRSGDIDPEIIFYLIKKMGYNNAKNMIEHKSGLAGLTSLSGEMEDVLAAAHQKISDPNYKPDFSLTKDLEGKASLALEIYINRIKKYIGGYAALMNGVDIIAFTGKIGADSETIRNKVMNSLDFLNCKNIVVVNPDEELAMAREIINL